MSKFAISIKTDEFVPRAELKETMKAFVKLIEDPNLTALVISLLGKPDKKGKVQVQVIELPLTPLKKK